MYSKFEINIAGTNADENKNNTAKSLNVLKYFKVVKAILTVS